MLLKFKIYKSSFDFKILSKFYISVILVHDIFYEFRQFTYKMYTKITATL